MKVRLTLRDPDAAHQIILCCMAGSSAVNVSCNCLVGESGKAQHLGSAEGADVWRVFDHGMHAGPVAFVPGGWRGRTEWVEV